MRKVNLATLWNAYQPPIQRDDVLKRVDRECYNPVFQWLSRNKGLKVNITANRSLEELLIKNKCSKTLDYLGTAVQHGSVELMGSLAYHPLAPLLITSKYGKDEIKRQNELNDSFNKGIFKSLWNPSGFYLPEFGYSDEVGKVVREMGYDYTVTNALLYAEKNRKPQPFDRIVQINGLNLFFTSNWSREFAMNRPDNGDFDTRRLMNDMFNGMCKWFADKKGYTMWGYDIETIGHHQKGYGEHTLDLILRGIRDNDMESVHLKELIKMFPKTETAEIFPGTQSTGFYDICNKEYFPLWKHSQNRMHQKIWALEDYAINVINETSKVNGKLDAKNARSCIDKGLYSCKAWQANPSLGHFIPWIIIDGANMLFNGIDECCYALKRNNLHIKINEKTTDADAIKSNAGKMVFEIYQEIWKETRDSSYSDIRERVMLNV